MIYNVGMGDVQTQAQITHVGTIATSVGAPIALAVAGASVAIPFIGPAIAGITLLISLFTKRGAQKEATTHIVDEVEPYLKQNLQAWQSSTKTLAEQQQAVTNFDTLWNQVVQGCGNPNYGDPGKWCTQDRQRGGKWDWFAMYRDPIANDPGVQANSVSSLLSAFTGSGTGPNILLVIGGVALIGYLLSS